MGKKEKIILVTKTPIYGKVYRDKDGNITSIVETSSDSDFDERSAQRAGYNIEALKRMERMNFETSKKEIEERKLQKRRSNIDVLDW